MSSPIVASPDWKFVTGRFSHFLAFGFGAGLVPRLPGTAGTVVGLALYLLLSKMVAMQAMLAITAIAFVVGTWASGVTEKALGAADHGGIVIDEIVAFWLVLLFVPQTVWWFASAFVLFRLFDILKPWPIRFFDRHIPGGFGIMFDDLLAASYALIVVELGVRFLYDV